LLYVLIKLYIAQAVQFKLTYYLGSLQLYTGCLT
jgi:hypothetical protein